MQIPKVILALVAVLLPLTSLADFRAGAVVVDVSPLEFPVLVNGGMTSRSATGVEDPINARALVLSDGESEVAIVVVDSCMMGRPVLDEAKKLAAKRTGIPMDRMLISATHTHTAPASMGCLGTPSDPRYTPYLIQKLAEAIALAQKELQPAQIGWNVEDAAGFTALRRWVRRPDKVIEDPFGNPTVRANMHSGRTWADVTGESGPEDPELTLISVQTREGQPLALLANFSMHYFSGVKPLSADYFGIFANYLKSKLGPDSGFVGIMSHGCSGDIWRRDYSVRDWSTNPPPKEEQMEITSYAEGLALKALKEYDRIQHRSDVEIAMAETRMRLNYRVPDRQRLEWAERIIAGMGDRKPKTSEEVYALEQPILHERQSTEIVLQGLQIGDIAIATTPNETYALTGLKLKAMSPLPKTMVIELANGGDGYIPPPEQHFIGGYNTWAARSAGLEVEAEPKIVEAGLQLLEKVSGQPRRPHRLSQGAACEVIRKSRPVSWWRLDEFAGPRAIDYSGHHRDGFYENGVVFYLEGARSDAFSRTGELNRAAHFCGGRVQSRIDGLADRYSVSLWFWNGMPDGARDIAGWMFSRDHDHGLSPHGDHLGLDGQGRLVFLHGDDSETAATGSTSVDRWTWNHAVLVRDGDRVRIHLNGNARPEIETRCAPDHLSGFDTVFVGGRSDRVDTWEGRLDEAAIFDRVLTPEEIRTLSARP